MPRRSTSILSPRQEAGGPPIPYVYMILFVVLAVSLVFNAYLFMNTKQHVENSRQEELIEEQMFQQASDEKKDMLARAQLRREQLKKDREAKSREKNQPNGVRGQRANRNHDANPMPGAYSKYSSTANQK